MCVCVCVCVCVSVCVCERNRERERPREGERALDLSLACSLSFHCDYFSLVFFCSHEILLQGMFAFDIIDHIGGGPMGLVTPVWLEKVQIENNVYHFELNRCITILSLFSITIFSLLENRLQILGLLHSGS